MTREQIIKLACMSAYVAALCWFLWWTNDTPELPPAPPQLSEVSR